MKKIILFLSIFALTFSSCSDNEDDSVDPFIGTWQVHQLFIDNVEEPLDACEKMATIVVNANGMFTSSGFDEVNGNCTLEETISGTWENRGNGTYRVILGDEVTDIKLTFEGNTFSSLDIDGSTTFREVFIRK